MEHSNDKLVVCPVCKGTPIDHGDKDPNLRPPVEVTFYGRRPQKGFLPRRGTRGHDWRLDEWSLTEPVVFRCRQCNATAWCLDREGWHRIHPSGKAARLPGMRNQLYDGNRELSPCDVCGGTGVVPMRDDTQEERIRAIISRRAARGYRGGKITVSPRVRRRDLAVVSTCPQCGKRDRVVPIIRKLDLSEHERDLVRFGEAFSPRTARYCGRCDLAFGNVDQEVAAGLG